MATFREIQVTATEANDADTLALQVSAGVEGMRQITVENLKKDLARKPASVTAGNLVQFDANGNAVDSTKKIEDLVQKSEVINNLTSEDTNKPLSAKQGKELEDKKANFDGSYETMHVGDATNLTGKGDSVPAVFTDRTAGGTADIADGTATIEKLKGNTIVWNQRFYAGATRTINGLTLTRNTNESVAITGTCTVSDNYTIGSISNLQNHVIVVNYLSNNPATLSLNENGERITAAEGVRVVSTTSNRLILFRAEAGTTYNVTVWVNAFDLTQMFGAGKEPATVEEFTSLFPKDYYSYNAGELLSFNATGIKTVGFNQLPSGGTWQNIGGVLLYSTEIKPFDGQTYFYRDSLTTHNSVWGIRGFNALDVLVSNQETSYGATLSFTANSNAVKYKLFVYSANTIPTPTNPCLNLSWWEGIRDGDYEEYWTQTRPLPIETYFPNGMRSAGVAFDELTKDKAITRIGAVDMGSLGWGYSGSRFIASFGSKLAGSLNVLCTKYKTITLAELLGGSDKSISADPGTGLYVRDSAYTTAAAFKTAMSGVMLYYELATPTEVAIEPPLNLGYQVSDFGTEEIISDSETEPPTAPCNFEIVYGLNAVDTLRNLDVNYTNIDTLDALLAVLGTVCNGTLTKAWDDTNRKYTFTFTPNAQEG